MLLDGFGFPLLRRTGEGGRNAGGVRREVKRIVLDFALESVPGAAVSVASDAEPA